MGDNGHLEISEIRKLTLEETLAIHLLYNFFPPISRVFIPCVKEAINKAKMDDYDSVIDLPNGKQRTVSELIKQLHLESFLKQDDE